MPTHTNTGLPSNVPIAARRWVTAAITASVASPVSKKPPRNNHGSAPSVVTMWSSQHSAPSAIKPTTATPSRNGPRSRIGPRITAAGRQTMANAEPSSSPTARVGVDRYRVSVLLMQRPATCQ